LPAEALSSRAEARLPSQTNRKGKIGNMKRMPAFRLAKHAPR
jgi:hypothetical protein